MHSRPEVAQIGKITLSSVDKRQRTEGAVDRSSQPKQDKPQDDDSDEEMEIDEDEEKEQQSDAAGLFPSRIICWDLFTMRF